MPSSNLNDCRDTNHYSDIYVCAYMCNDGCRPYVKLLIDTFEKIKSVDESIKNTDALLDLNWFSGAEKFLLLPCGNFSWKDVERFYPYECYGISVDDDDGFDLNFHSQTMIKYAYRWHTWPDADEHELSAKLRLKNAEELARLCHIPKESIRPKLTEMIIGTLYQKRLLENKKLF